MLKTVFKPQQPKHGNLIEIGTDVWVAYTGGKPSADWSQLESAPTTTIGPNQYRATSISTQAKSQYYRTQGLETKFSKGKDLQTFQRKIFDHMKLHGMDTITYLEDPYDKSKLVSVVQDYGRYDLEEAIKLANKTRTNHFDKYDDANQVDARKYLMNSLDDELETELYNNCEDEDCFGAVWFNLIQIIQSSSMERYERVKDRIKNRSIKDFEGENVEKCAAAHYADYKELHSAGVYDPKLTLNILNGLMEAGGTANEDFRFPLRKIKLELESKLRAIAHKPYAEAHKDLCKSQLDAKSVLKQAKTEYRNLLDNDKWPAAAHAKDSKALNKNYGNVNAAATAEKLVHALIQSVSDRDKSQDSCNNCGKLGHWARDCPQKKTERKGIGGGRTGTSVNKGSTTKRNGKRKDEGNRQKTPPPKPGESEITYINGTKKYWCAKCKRWTLSHGTDAHKGKDELKKLKDKTSANVARVNFDVHPAAYKVVIHDKLAVGPHASMMHWITPVRFLLLWTILVPLLWLDITAISNNIFSTVTHVARSHAMWIASTTLSGLLGLGTACWLSTQVEDPPTRDPWDPTQQPRLRTGPNVRKQAWRRFNRAIQPYLKAQHQPRSAHVPPHCVRQALTPHQRFNNTGRRNRCYEQPHIWKLERRINSLQSHVNDLEQRLRRLYKEAHGPFKNDRRHTGKPHHAKGSPHSARHHYDFTSPPLRWPVAMASLVNLSRISSSQAEREQTHPSEADKVLFDSGANCCVTNRQDDFAGQFETLPGNAVVDGIGKGLNIMGKGTVAWTFKATNGMYRTLRLPCYYVPSSNIRIASTRVILDTYPGETLLLKSDGLTLSGKDGVAPIQVPYCGSSKLPLGQTHDARPRVYVNDDTLAHEQAPALTVKSNVNLTEPEKEILRWHQRLGHIGMKKVQWLMRQGILGTTEHAKRLHNAAAKLTQGPMCTACQYAKQRRRTTPGTIKRTIKEEHNMLKTDDLFPGSKVSVDHFECNPRGRLLTSFGKERADHKYKGGCIFVDHATGYIHVELQAKLNTHETLRSKKDFELECTTHGVIPQSYITDKGSSFTSDEFNDHLSEFQQTVRHATPGGHHANGIAERSISTVMSISRAMLHHAAIHWADVADVELWPLAVLHAVFILNRIPREESGRSPLELFSRKTWPTSKFQDFHVWGAPAYVLDTSLANGRTIPRWKARSSRCVFVGNRTKRGHGVPLVLNLETGAITSQYHVIMDNWFQTVEAASKSTINFDDDDWYKTFGLTEWQYIPDDSDEPHDMMPHSASEGANQRERLRATRQSVEATQAQPHQSRETQGGYFQSAPMQRRPTKPNRDAWVFNPPAPTSADSHHTNPTAFDPRSTDLPRPPMLRPSSDPTPRPLPAPDSSTGPPSPSPQPEAPPPSPPQREKEPAQRATREVTPVKFRPDEHMRQTRSQTGPRRSRRIQDLSHSSSAAHAFYQDILPSPFAGKAKKVNTDPDTLTWDEAMHSPYRQEFLDSAEREIQELTKKGTWKEDLKSNATTKIVPNKWVFRIKRTSDGSIRKFKGRICLRGDLQEDNGKSNYSPVAAWPTVRSFLVISHIRNWMTTSINFSNAFVQSYLPDDEPVWMHVPRGYKCTQGSEYCLRLIKSLYGLRNAPQLWFNYSSKAFRYMGLKPSKHDECLWYGDNLMVVQYVDDCGISAPTKKHVDDFVQGLRDYGLELTVEGSFEEFLGIKFNSLPDGSIECTQRGLIQKILETANMTNCNPNTIPAALNALGSDKEGEPMSERWNYRGICGMLLYLSTNTRPDITFAVSQVCRFSTDPKKSHATAVKTILRYLKCTFDKGMIIKPSTNQFNLDMYVDADFCGLFGQEDSHNVDSARSRTGYIVTLGSWPIIWKSTLQDAVTQSTTESEYYALSTALRTYLPLKWLIEEMVSKTKCDTLEASRILCTVFEDNQSAYYLATNQRITNRTKYFLAKWHWFWQSYRDGIFQVVKCPTTEQAADYLTKPLSKTLFQHNRKVVQGW